MKFIRYYSQEIYTVITLLFISLSAIFVTPDLTQKLVIAYALCFLLHEWEEGVYPGGFVDMMMGEIINVDFRSTATQQRESRIYIDILILVFTFVPYFANEHEWLILPLVYLGFLEGFVHTASMKIFKMNRKYTPGMVTALCQFSLSVVSLVILIPLKCIAPWQYAAGFIGLLGCFVCAQSQVATKNGLKYTEMPKLIRSNLKRVRAK